MTTKETASHSPKSFFCLYLSNIYNYKNNFRITKMTCRMIMVTELTFNKSG